MDPIVITGTGCISAAGPTPHLLWQHCLSAEPARATLTVAVGAQKHVLPVAAVSQIGLDPQDQPGTGKLDRTCQLAIHASRQAWRSAGLNHTRPAPLRIGVFLGTSRGPVDRWSLADECIHQNKPLIPSLAATGSTGAISGAVSQRLGIKGPSMTIAATCASAAHAIATGANFIRSREIDIALVGGAEAPLVPTLLAQMLAAGIVSQSECRPFAANRDGLVPGEGAGVLVLESEDSAHSRKANPIGRLAGWSLQTSPTVGKTGTDPSGDALHSVISAALAHSDLSPADIGYVNAHGTGTVANDAAEAAAIFSAFGSNTPLTSTKPITGHCLGATAALEAIVCLAALEHGTIPTQSNTGPCDPQLPALNLPSSPIDAPELRHLLSLSAGFWGKNAALVFSK